jgi:protein-S-isoprenylcysteine O-methyltransferase Ste14
LWRPILRGEGGLLTPIGATYLVWAAWVISWFAAAAWTKRTASRAPAGDQAAYRIVTFLGFLLLIVFRSGVPGPDDQLAPLPMLWPVSDALAWAMVAACGLGFGFAWWARVALGSNWSSTVTRKENHQIIEAGPYRFVRHPIYTGMLFAVYATAVEIGTVLALLGAALITFGFWLKARLEERFLSEELGPEAYAAYRRRTPMLIPFWPLRG